MVNITDSVSRCMERVVRDNRSEPVGTADLLATVLTLDPQPWSELELHIGTPERLRSYGALDPAGEPETCLGVTMTPACAHAFRYAEALATCYDLPSITTRLLALALVADPASGAVAAIQSSSGISYCDALERFEEQVDGGSFEPSMVYPPWSSEPLAASGPGEGDVNDLGALRTRALVFSRGAQPEARHLLAAVCLHARGWLGEVLSWLSLDRTQLRDLAVLERVASGDEEGEALIARSTDLADAAPTAYDVLLAAFLRPTKSIERWVGLVRLAPAEVVAQLRRAELKREGRDPQASTMATFLSLLLVVSMFVIAALAVRDCLSSEAWWKLPFVYFAFLGYPAVSFRGELVRAVVFGVLFSPLVGAVCLVEVGVSVLCSISTRNASVSDLGIKLTTEQYRRVLQRERRSSRRWRQWRQDFGVSRRIGTRG